MWDRDRPLSLSLSPLTPWGGQRSSLLRTHSHIFTHWRQITQWPRNSSFLLLCFGRIAFTFFLGLKFENSHSDMFMWNLGDNGLEVPTDTGGEALWFLFCTFWKFLVLTGCFRRGGLLGGGFCLVCFFFLKASNAIDMIVSGGKYDCYSYFLSFWINFVCRTTFI